MSSNQVVRKERQIMSSLILPRNVRLDISYTLLPPIEGIVSPCVQGSRQTTSIVYDTISNDGEAIGRWMTSVENSYWELFSDRTSPYMTPEHRSEVLKYCLNPLAEDKVFVYSTMTRIMTVRIYFLRGR